MAYAFLVRTVSAGLSANGLRLKEARASGMNSLLRGKVLSGLGSIGEHDPPLQLRDRLRLFDRHRVADLVGLRLGVRVIVLRAAHRLLQQRMRETALDLDDQGLLLLVADDDALEDSLRHGLVLSLCSWRRASARRWF